MRFTSFCTLQWYGWIEMENVTMKGLTVSFECYGYMLTTA